MFAHWSVMRERSIQTVPFKYPTSTLLVVLCKCLCQLVVRVNDQLEKLTPYGHCAHFTFDDLCILLSCNFCCNLLK